MPVVSGDVAQRCVRHRLFRHAALLQPRFSSLPATLCGLFYSPDELERMVRWMAENKGPTTCLECLAK